MERAFGGVKQRGPTAHAQTASMRRPSWSLVLGALLLMISCLALLLMHRAQYDSRILFSKRPSPDWNPAETDDSEFYTWRTSSSYDLVSDSAELSQQELCKHFPKHKLFEIQPVLKTGHGVMERVRQSLWSTSACLDNLLIFSDLDEQVDDRLVTNIIADIPEHVLRLTTQTKPYFAFQKAAAVDVADLDMDSFKGQEMDKFKFLPAISRAWRMAPEKRWYVFYEGDTYIVWDTVFRLLDNSDADLDHYFGSPSPGREGTWFGK